MQDRIRIRSVETLSKDWGQLKRTLFDFRRRDGRWQTQSRETFARGDGAAVLPFDPDRGTVLLVRQFRLPALVTGHEGFLLEACAGLLDGEAPDVCIAREAIEEMGCRLRHLQPVFTLYMNPGSLAERMHFFLARYGPSDRISAGGGHPEEGEDIEVIEMRLDEALGAVAAGDIVDAKTVILVQLLAQRGLIST